MIIGITGAVAGRVKVVRPHPDGQLIWLADVCLGVNDPPVQIVFGGDRQLRGGELVPVAPPGARATVLCPDGSHRHKKMRVRRYRGQRSHGMLCSLDELGWIRGGPNEVAILRDVTPGESLDNLSERRRTKIAIDWTRAKQMAKRSRRSQLRLLRLGWLLLLGWRSRRGSQHLPITITWVELPPSEAMSSCSSTSR